MELYAQYDHSRLMPFLRASNFYDLERALSITEKQDYVHETVFLLGRMGNNLKALKLIIERLGDVKLAIDFAEEQRDDDLWEALIAHSETRPDFIRALLEHGGSEIKPVRLIQRIQEGLEIPGLKPALVKVLQASNLQVSLLKGCQRILNGDCSALALELQAAQTGGAHANCESTRLYRTDISEHDMPDLPQAALPTRRLGIPASRSPLPLPALCARDLRRPQRRRRASRATRERRGDTPPHDGQARCDREQGGVVARARRQAVVRGDGAHARRVVPGVQVAEGGCAGGYVWRASWRWWVCAARGGRRGVVGLADWKLGHSQRHGGQARALARESCTSSWPGMSSC